jgi:hypothetical protein
MTNELTINLNKNDIVKAIEDYVAKKYPTFEHKAMFIAYNSTRADGYVKGTIKEG